MSLTHEPSCRSKIRTRIYILTFESFVNDVEGKAPRQPELRLPHVGVQISNLPVPAEGHDTKS